MNELILYLEYQQNAKEKTMPTSEQLRGRRIAKLQELLQQPAANVLKSLWPSIVPQPVAQSGVLPWSLF